MLNGLDIVIWRSESAVVQAWQNQCPHRGMRLSFGQVRGEQLSCRYHGWEFDQQGQCSRIPSQPDLKPAKTLCVPGYQCIEQAGLIWINTDNTNTPKSFPEEISSVPGQAKQHDWRFCKTLYLDYSQGELFSLLQRTSFSFFDSRKPNPELSYESTSCQTGLVLVNAYEKGDQSGQLLDTILIALHSLDDNSTALHLCFQGTGNKQIDRNKNLHFHSWAKTLRWFLQNPDGEYDGIHPLIHRVDSQYQSSSQR